jgi:hypothetical protein
MNERIKELSKQAWEWAEQQEYKDATQEFSDILEQKFAELIIQECIGVADHSNVTGKSIIGQRIKEHFEIERPKKVVYPKLLPRKFPEDEE